MVYSLSLKNVDELASQLQAFINLPEDVKQQMSQQALQTANRYTVDVIAEQLPTIFLMRWKNESRSFNSLL